MFFIKTSKIGIHGHLVKESFDVENLYDLYEIGFAILTRRCSDPISKGVFVMMSFYGVRYLICDFGRLVLCTLVYIVQVSSCLYNFVQTVL